MSEIDVLKKKGRKSKIKTKEVQEVLVLNQEVLNQEVLDQDVLVQEVLDQEVLDQEVQEVQEVEVSRRRGRKKKFKIESIKKLRDAEDTEDKLVFASNNDHLESLENQVQVSFGNMSITMYNQNPVNKQELRKMFDNDFELSVKEKAPSVMLQENKTIRPEIKKSEIKTVKDLLEPQNPKDQNEIQPRSRISTDIQNPSRISDTNQKIENKIRSLPVLKKNIHKVLNDHIKEFKKESSWPEKTSVWCWHCCHPFTDVPIPCPILYNEITEIFTVKGIFCSWPCVCAYSIDNYKSLTNVFMLRKKCENFDISMLKVAPSKVTLSVFGGYMSIEEYRSSTKDGSDHKFTISTDHISYANMDILETYTELNRSSKN